MREKVMKKRLVLNKQTISDMAMGDVKGGIDSTVGLTFVRTQCTQCIISIIKCPIALSRACLSRACSYDC